jgi:hypothetical protein
LAIRRCGVRGSVLRLVNETIRRRKRRANLAASESKLCFFERTAFIWDNASAAKSVKLIVV